VSLFKLIDAEKADYSISLLCRVLKVSRSGYYDWKDRPPSKRDRENAALTCWITQIHERSTEEPTATHHGCTTPNFQALGGGVHCAAGNEWLG
jgi:hypothetical protein